ncbi:Eri3 [Symbiodinium sp. CCMP2456]|nr:Eri3 [Symbiodinium sp. CCMP2456]
MAAVAKEPRVLPFYGHRKSADFAEFSNFFELHKPYEFVLPRFAQREGFPKSFECWFSEASIMACKAALFDDKETFDKILKAQRPGQAKALGRQVHGFDDNVWLKHVAPWRDSGEEETAYEVVLQKFRSDQRLATVLLKTGDAVIVEAAPDDRLWGVGLPTSDPRVYDPEQWQGRNILGFALMKARDALKAVAVPQGEASEEAPAESKTRRETNLANCNSKISLAQREAEAALPWDCFAVLDFEATCEENVKLNPQEIIEFPLVLVDAQSLERVDEFRTYVRPERNPKLTEFCTELTGILQEQVDAAPVWTEALKQAQKWLHKRSYGRCLLVTCGDWDLRQMMPAQCKLHDELWAKWEKIDEIRATYREHGKIFFSLDPSSSGRVPKITVKEAAHAAQVLKPLLECIQKAPRDSKGSVRLFSVPACEKQLQKLAVLIFGAGNVPAKFADTPKKDAWCCKQMCSLVKLKIRKLRETGKAPKSHIFRDLMELIADPRADSVALPPSDVSTMVVDVEEDEDCEYDFRGESSESGASVAESVAADDDLDDMPDAADSSEDPFGFFDAAEAEASLKRDEVATGEDDGHFEVPQEEPSTSSSSAAVPPVPKLAKTKEAVFIDVDDESVTCGNCEVPKVLCRCLQIDQLKKQLNALRVQRRARKLAKQAQLARRAEDIFKRTCGEDDSGCSGSGGATAVVPFPLPEDDTQVMPDADLDAIADKMKTVSLDSDDEPEPPVATRFEIIQCSFLCLVPCEE